MVRNIYYFVFKFAWFNIFVVVRYLNVKRSGNTKSDISKLESNDSTLSSAPVLTV